VTKVWERADYMAREERRAVDVAARARVQRRWPTALVTHVVSWPWARRADVRVSLLFEREELRLDVWPWRGWRGWLAPVRWQTPRVSLLHRAAGLGLESR